MKRSIWGIAGGIALVAICISVLLTRNNSEILRETVSIWEYSDTVYDPMLIGESVPDIEFYMQENGLDFVNYWVMTSAGIGDLRSGDATQLEKVEEILSSLMGTFERNGYFPRPAYDEFEYGWVSAMDAPPIAVLAQMMYEKTGDEKYQSFVSELSEYMLKDVSEYGYIAKIDGERWLFEYANADTDAESGLFVLNGSMLGTLGTAMIAQATANQDLLELVESQTRLYEKMMPRFWYEDDSWCYYSLRDSTVNQPHYIIFEIRLLKALAEVTEESFYQQEAQRRIDLLKSYYKIYVYEENGSQQYMFLRSGAPHYYYTDIYTTELVFFDQNDRELDRQQLAENDPETACMVGEYPPGTERIEWHIIPSELWSLDMGDLAIMQVDDSINMEPILLDCDYTASSDGAVVDSVLQIDSELSEEERCNFMGTFSQPISTSAEKIYALEVNNQSDTSFSANIVLYSADGTAISWYLKPILPGKNLLVFSPLGCSEYGRNPITDIDFFNLRLYTVGMEDVSAEIEIGNLMEFNNTLSFANELTSTEYCINWGA